jgi:hypothetical protein
MTLSLTASPSSKAGMTNYRVRVGDYRILYEVLRKESLVLVDDYELSEEQLSPCMRIHCASTLARRVRSCDESVVQHVRTDVVSHPLNLESRRGAF